MRNLDYLNQYRKPLMGFMGDSYNGMFEFKILGSPVRVIASNGESWEHVSISHASRTPSWEMMQKLKEMFFEDDEVVMQLHPKKSEYKNIHKHCLHLWRPINQEIPTPPVELV